MKAMILAAGLGTRLRPLTNDRPKALVTVAGRTLLEIALERLRSFGVSEVIVNTHHYAEMVVAYLKAHDNFGMKIEVSREEELLDTGGGLKKAAHFFLDSSGNSAEPFILHNVDVLSTIDLEHMMRFHRAENALATLAVQDRETSRYLLFDGNGQLCGRRTRLAAKTGEINDELVRTAPELHALEPGPTPAPPQVAPEVHALEPALTPAPPQVALAFSGIHVLSPQIFAKMEEEGAFSIITAYLHLAAQGEKIVAFRADESSWRDLGRPESILQAERDLG
jgi:NDP-sugar pyrophosphorylase family protein